MKACDVEVLFCKLLLDAFGFGGGIKRDLISQSSFMLAVFMIRTVLSDVVTATLASLALDER